MRKEQIIAYKKTPPKSHKEIIKATDRLFNQWYKRYYKRLKINPSYYEI